MCRAVDSTPVRVQRPETFATDARREVAVKLLELSYSAAGSLS